MSTATKTENKTTLLEFCALWKRKSMNGKPYFSGRTTNGLNIVAFYNTNRKDLKEPDLRVYSKDEEGNTDKKEYFSLWCNTKKDGSGKYLSGKINGERLIAFFNPKATEDNKQPYIRVYFSKEQEAPKQAAPAAPKGYNVPNAKPAEWEEVGIDEELPF